MSIRPFTIAVSDAEIADLKQRLAQTRWPPMRDAGWEMGMDGRFLGGFASLALSGPSAFLTPNARCSGLTAGRLRTEPISEAVQGGMRCRLRRMDASSSKADWYMCLDARFEAISCGLGCGQEEGLKVFQAAGRLSEWLDGAFYARSG